MTPAEKYHQEQVARIGCIACLLDGHESPSVSIHHVHGRTRKHAHMMVLPLCAGHHQARVGVNRELTAVHPYKARFEQLYGPQDSLLTLVEAIIGGLLRQSDLLDNHRQYVGQLRGEQNAVLS